MPGTRHEPAAAAPAQVTILSDWRALRPHEPAIEALHHAAGTPVTARLAWWRSAVTGDPGVVPVLATRRGPGGTLRAAALVALRDQNGSWQLTSGRPHSDDVWEAAAVSAGARRAVLAELASFARGLSRPWQLVLTGLRHGDDATWLAGQLPAGRAVPAPPVPGIGFTHDEVTFAPGIRRGLDRSGHRIRQHELTEEISFEREPARLATLREEVEAVHRARDHDAGRVSDLDEVAGAAFWRSVYDLHAANGELEVATLRLDGHLAAYVVALIDPPAYRVFDGRFAPLWRLYSPGRRLEAAVVDHARRRHFRVLDWMSSVAPEKLVASTWAEPRWAVTAACDRQPAFTAGDSDLAMTAAAP
ncbi:MAG: GNAT family N-acetyltransferase [Streptosporangiaceae bacterium]